MSGRPLRVVHVVQHLKAGGAEVIVRALARGLRARGVDARFLSVYPDQLSDGERGALEVPVRSVERRSRTDLAFFGRLRQALREERADIVHAHLIAGKYAGRFAAVLERVPRIVFTEHGDKTSGPLERAISRALDAKTDRFITFSGEHRADLARSARIPIERIVVIPNGVPSPVAADRDALRVELDLPPDAFVLYMPARFSPEKNQSLALRAFAGVANARPQWRLVFAGSGATESAIREVARELGIAERVRFLGYREDAAQLLSAMDAFVLPSLNERMPLALGEAMRAGLPAISTPWLGCEALLRDGETAYVASDFGIDAFATALERLDDDAARRRIAAAGKAFADERFDLAACVDAHVALYESLHA